MIDPQLLWDMQERLTAERDGARRVAPSMHDPVTEAYFHGVADALSNALVLLAAAASGGPVPDAELPWEPLISPQGEDD